MQDFLHKHVGLLFDTLGICAKLFIHAGEQVGQAMLGDADLLGQGVRRRQRSLTILRIEAPVRARKLLLADATLRAPRCLWLLVTRR